MTSIRTVSHDCLLRGYLVTLSDDSKVFVDDYIVEAQGSPEDALRQEVARLVELRELDEPLDIQRRCLPSQ